MSEPQRPSDRQLVAQGRREGLSLAALALSLVTFVHLLGAEKAILAIVLAVFALRGASYGIAKVRGRIALVLASAYLATLIAVLVMFHKELAEFIKLLSKLG
jgi:hypothetical protein